MPQPHRVRPTGDRKGHCSVCGPTPISKKGNGYRCATADRERQRQYRDELVSSGPEPAPRARCASCKRVKPRSQFTKRADRPSGLESYCKKCRSALLRKYRYEITEEQLEAMLKAQKGACAICRKKTELVIDHCHHSGTVRGLLCHSCNLGLGKFYDDAEVLRRAIDYLA